MGTYGEIFTFEQFILLFVLFVSCSVGAYARNTIDVWVKKNEKIMLNVTLISSLVLSVSLWCFSEFLISKIGYKPLIAIALLSGLLSYDVVTRMTSVEGIKQLLEAVRYTLGLLKEFRDFKSSKSSDKKEEKKEEK